MVALSCLSQSTSFRPKNISPPAGHNRLVQATSVGSLRLIIIFFVIADGLWFPSCALGFEETLEKVRAGYVQSISSMRSISSRSSLFRVGKNKFVPDMKNVKVDWDVDGRRFALHIYAQEGSVSSMSPVWLSYDGQLIWSVNYQQLDGIFRPDVVVTHSLRTATDGTLRIHRTPGQWLGVYFNISESQQSGSSLESMLNSSTATFAGEESVNDNACYRVDCEFVTSRPGETLPVSVWLDPSVGFLPRRIETEFNIGQPKQQYTVLGFRQVFVDDLDRRLWFPTEMAYEDKLCSDKLVVDFVSMSPQNKSAFRPQVDSSVSVVNAEDSAAVKKFYDKSRMKQIAATKTETNNTGSVQSSHSAPTRMIPGIVASPGFVNWQNILLWVGAACVVLFVVLKYIQAKWRRLIK
jgi:hypothetical protein